MQKSRKKITRGKKVKTKKIIHKKLNTKQTERRTDIETK